MRRLAVLAVSTTLLLSACGSDDEPGSTAAPSASTSAAATPGGTATPLGTEVGFTASGAYGDKPTLTFPEGDAPATLSVQVVEPGDGPEVQSGDALVADYLGQVWGGDVFDNSYDKGEVASFTIGSGQVIPGWDKTLVGQKAGSRVLLSIPAAEGYGTTGNEQAGIKGTDTIVFVVDIVASYGKDSLGEADAVSQDAKLPKGVTVEGALGAAATITVAKGYKAPAQPKVTVLAEGSGKPVTDKIYLAYSASGPGGPAETSYGKAAPPAISINDPNAGPFAKLKGVPLGSRVLLEVPADKAANRPTAAVFVLDLLGEPLTAKQAAAG